MLPLAASSLLPACGGAAGTEAPPFVETMGSADRLDHENGAGGSAVTPDANTGGAGAKQVGGDDGATSPTPPPAGYPEGPYGEDDPVVGDVIENITFEGFARIGDGKLVNSGEIVPITLEHLRAQGENYALIHTATIWCPSCRDAADDFAARADEITALGAVLIELVLEGNGNPPPTDLELSTWVSNSDLTMTTVRPGDDRTNVVFPSREYVYIIDLTDMTVVWAEQALFTDPTITALGFDAFFELL